jgi:hypothetical protein
MKNTISLCCIAGNAEKYIDRFLDSFQPHFDEVCIVRACGNQKPDATLEVAESRGCKVGENRLGMLGMSRTECDSHPRSTRRLAPR